MPSFRPCLECGHRNPHGVSACDACGSGLTARVGRSAVESPGWRQRALGTGRRFLRTLRPRRSIPVPDTRVLLAAAGAVVVIAVVVAVGLLLRKEGAGGPAPITVDRVRALFEAEGLDPALVQTVPSDADGPENAAVVGFDDLPPEALESAIRTGFGAFELERDPPLARLTLLVPGPDGSPREIQIRPEDLLFSEGPQEVAATIAAAFRSGGAPAAGEAPAPSPPVPASVPPPAQEAGDGSPPEGLFGSEDPAGQIVAPAGDPGAAERAGVQAEGGTGLETALYERPDLDAALPTMAYRPNVMEPERLKELLEGEFLMGAEGEEASLRGDAILVRANAERFPAIRRYLIEKEREARGEGRGSREERRQAGRRPDGRSD